MARLGRRAIVIGAGMGGLLASRALADHYDEVTILERDVIPEADEPRKCIPQGQHTRPGMRGARTVVSGFHR